ncbi:glycosyltransferase family 2 protein [Dongia sedimenti]|uniref:Glycosyltransferase family A protein n=1 Tax=Dongia sedimenti TaxID=3064282 RepID=A0ABU0YR59_9PROT|nr:glycosyltransferase family A protein [Rhodospirillaceae bacterium R-7]
MTEPRISLSVIIANYNYAEFVGIAIESALAIDWPDVEVVVVDDGSTDNSRAVIEKFGDRVIAIFQENAGQIAARNLGFARSRGEAIILLDSDDALHPSIMREVVEVWHPGVSKVQFRMRGIDAEGRPNGSVFPQYRESTTPAEVRRWATATGSYPAPPCSGNLFSRACLEAIFPLDDCCGKAPDTCCVAAAPFLGEVVTIAKPLADYRVHGRNDGAMSTLDRSRFGWQTVSAIQRFEYSQRIARRVGLDVSDRGKHLAFAQLRTRIASFRLAREGHPILGDNTLRILLDLVRAGLTPQGASLKETVTTVAWGALVLLMPRGIAETLVHWRFSPGARPPVLRSALSAMGIVR